MYQYIKKYIHTQATPGELLEHNRKINYIPHFAIVNKNKFPSKPRLVFDAAAKNEGSSLNSFLLSGPDATTSLFGVLIRFRKHEIACSGDIKEMFHQVKVGNS